MTLNDEYLNNDGDVCGIFVDNILPFILRDQGNLGETLFLKIGKQGEIRNLYLPITILEG
jgi:hypothetical protein